MRKILVTAISGDVANGILKILKDTSDEVYGCDIYDFPVGMDKVKAYWKSELAVAENYVVTLLEQCINFGITHIIPVNESEIEIIDNHREEFKKVGIKLLLNRTDILKIFLDKKFTVDFLSTQVGLVVPKTYQLNEFVEDGREYIVKFRNSCGSKLLKKIHTKEEIIDLGLEERNYIIQEYLPQENEEYTVGVFSDERVVDIIVFRRKLRYGYTAFVELVEDKAINEIAEKVARYINLKGYINLQMRKDGKEYKIFEINPRISGTVRFRHMLGFQDVLWWLDLLDGKERKNYKQRYKKAIGMRELNEKYVILEKK